MRLLARLGFRYLVSTAEVIVLVSGRRRKGDCVRRAVDIVRLAGGGEGNRGGNREEER